MRDKFKPTDRPPTKSAQPFDYDELVVLAQQRFNAAFDTYLLSGERIQSSYQYPRKEYYGRKEEEFQQSIEDILKNLALAGLSQVTLANIADAFQVNAPQGER